MGREDLQPRIFVLSGQVCLLVKEGTVSDDTKKPLALEDLPELRRKTESVSRFLRGQIAAHLETLRPLFAPERIFGKYAGGKVEVSGAERAFAELQQNYKAFTRKPYDLPETLDSNWLALVGNALELHPWEYVHQTQGKSITMSSPVRWAVNYRANYRLAQVKSWLDGKETLRPDYLRQFKGSVGTLVDDQATLGRSRSHREAEFEFVLVLIIICGRPHAGVVHDRNLAALDQFGDPGIRGGVYGERIDLKFDSGYSPVRQRFQDGFRGFVVRRPADIHSHRGRDLGFRPAHRACINPTRTAFRHTNRSWRAATRLWGDKSRVFSGRSVGAYLSRR